MAKCPWPPCGVELGKDPQSGVERDHPDHRRWAADADHAYVQVQREDGGMDVFQVKREDEAAFREQLMARGPAEAPPRRRRPR